MSNFGIRYYVYSIYVLSNEGLLYSLLMNAHTNSVIHSYCNISFTEVAIQNLLTELEAK
jgi:hypothetical protein